MFAQDVFERLGLSQDTDLLNDLQKEALLEPTEAAQSPYMDDPAYAGFETLRGLFGSNHGDNPSMYWLAQGEEMPEFATVADAQAAVWKDFQKKARAYQAEQERQQQAREALAATIDPFIDRYVRGDAVVPSPEQVMMMQEAGISWESVRRARRGMELVREYDAQGTLYDDRIINNLAEQVGDDELARRIVLNMFYNDARKYAKDKHGDEWTGIDWIDKAAQGVTGMVRTGGVKGWRTGQKAWRNLQVMGEVDAVTNAAKRLPELIASGMDVDEARAQIEKDATFLEIRRRWAADLVQTMEAGEKEYLEGEDRHLVGRIGSQLGSIIGDTAPWFIPAIGPAIGASSAMQSRRDEGVSIGLTMEETEKRAMMFGQADALEEMIAFSPIGRLTPGYKWLKKALGGGKAAGKLAPWRSRWMASPKAQYAIQGLSGAAEEAILEPTAGYLMRTVQSMNLTDERGKQTFRQYLDDMGQMMHGEQGLALLAFTFGMSGFNYPQIKKAAQEFGLSLQHYKELGGTAQGYLEAREEKTAEGFLNKALANLHDSWMEDPQASMERASAAAGERLSGERIESLRELDAWRAAEDAGMVPRVEPAEQEGMFRVYAPARSTKAPREDASVSREGQEENAPSYTLMDGEQMTAYLQAFVSEQVESDILYTQHLLAGDVTVNQALAQGRFDAAEVITRTVTDEQTGAERVVIAPETLGQMKARADMAMAAIRALEAEGVSYEDAADRMDASLSEHLPLGTLVKTWEEAQERIRTEQARNPEFKVPAMDAPFSNAYVTKVRRGDTFRRVLRYARGNATVEDLMEEAMEQAVISWQAEQGLTWGEFGAMLQEAQRAMNELFPEARGEEMQFIHLDAGKPVTGHDAIEAFSKIGRSRWLADAVNHPSLPSWLRKLLNHLVKFLGAFKARVQLGEMVRQAEEQGVFTLPVRQALAVMLDAGNALYRDQQGDLMELSMERARAQAELDAMFGAGVATEARTLEDELAESRKEDEERRKEAEDEARAPENSPEAQEARREREQARVEALGEPDGSGVFNGAFIEVQEGVRLGFIDKNKLTLCPDVPQFKQGADEQTGVVNPIVGAWQRNAAPISVWRREDGSLQVISGRHRFNACTDEDINCTVYDEAAGFDLDWAQTHDVENNIRDGQASLFEIARYVSQKGLTKEEAVERGIFRKGQSRRGVELGMYGCSDLLDALGNELVSPDDAWRVAMAFRNQTEVQRAGLRALMEGKSWQQAFAVMQVAANMDRIRGLAEAAGMTFETDLFGNSHAEEYFARLAQYAAARVSELTREISSISGASRRPETAKKYGVDVKDAAALEAMVKDLKAQRARWQNFGLHEDLIKEANDAVMVELGVKTREEVDRENGVLPLEAPEQEAVSADTGMLQLSQDVSRMLDAALARGAAPAEDEAPTANFSLVSIPSGEVITTAAEMRARLKPLQGKVFVNKNTGIQAVIEARVSGKTVGKAQQAQMSVANLKAVGFSAEEARKIHYTAATRIHELFENAEDGRFEEEYKDDPSRAGAYHFFNTVEIEGIGSFDVNVTALALKNEDQKLLYTLELTIENPKGVSVAYPNPDIQGDAYSASGVSTRNLSSYRSFVEKEKASIRKKAVADGTFMKAPNGADTNLTEDQWLSVRTAAFKNWFGDWEHDPQNASKVVDENGEPRVVYHGSHQWFTSFNDGKQRQQSGAPAGTIFANDNREIAVSFADYYGGHADEVILDPNDERHPRYSWGIYREGGIYDLFMNIRNPLVVDFEGRPWLDSSKGGDINALCSKAKESGHDGVIALNIVDAGLNDQENVPASTDYVAFDSVQVKSATQNRGTYDPKNPDITFSVIGPNAATWGKYADKAFAGRDDGKLRAEIDASQASLKAPENFPFLSMFDEWSRGMGYRKNPVWRGLLEDVLNFDELYEAYPSLRKMYVFAYKNKKDSARGYYDSEERSITINLAHIGPIGAQLSTLLHEIQHAIQDIEGFARGSNLEEGRSLDDYMRSAGEIESRNVEKRILWDGERRESKPFNDTLEFPGEAIVSFSIASAQEQGLFHDGNFEAGNAVITEPGVTFSIAALHASPHSFRKFDTAFMGKGEGNQAYGWGLYFAQNPEVNRNYMNWFAQDNATWKFGDVETSDMEVMHQALDDRLLPKDALPEVKEDASDMIWTVLGDLSDARGDEGKIEAIKKELREDIQHSMEYGRTYHQTLEKMVQLHGVYRSLIDLLDEIEVRPGMPSNYKVELNVEDSELLGWDYVDETVLALLKDSPVEEVRYALERAERRADYRGENVSGKDVYQELFDAFWDGEDGTKQEAQKAASVSLLSSDIKGIRYADGYTRGKEKEEQTYNYVIFDGKDIKITAFADESTGGAWADYEDPSATFSIIGEKAESFQEYHNNGLSYTDPADGKRKAIIDSRGVRLRKEHVSVSEGGHVNVSLAAALDFPELFRAYPELRKLRVDFYRDSRSGTGGFTDPQEHYIAVNVARGGKNAAPGMVLDTILHEVQHVIQGYEGFAVGAGNMSREQALAYLGESMNQLAGRDDAWAKEALPRLERMRQELEAGTLQPAFVYVFSHGEQEARLAGSFEKNSEGVLMSGLNGFRLLDAPPFSIPLTGDITELGGITFGAGRFGRMAGRVLAPNGDWLYDEMVFRMRAAMQRSVSKLRLYETGDRERSLELLAEAQELISTVERYLPGSYGFGLEPYKIWLNVFSLLYGNSGKMAPGDAVASALEAIPMKRWPEIMEGSIGRSFVNWAEKRPELEDVVEEARREIAERQADYELDSAPDADNRAALTARKGVEQEVWRRLFEEHGAEFLEEYGERKVFRLVGKFMERVVEQIDRFRKDRTLGRIRRVAASVAPRTSPQGKPLRGKMGAESYRRLEDRLRLMEMTPAQYDAFFRRSFPEVLDEEAAGQQEGRTLWEDVKPQDPVTVETTDAEGGALALTVTKATFEAYACYEKMSVETAENAARALGEFISTRREAWENAAESKKNEIEDLLRPVLEAAGRTDDQAMATHRKQARLKTLPSGPMSLTGYLLNFSQYMQGLQSVPAFRGIAKKFERRAARFAVQKQACEKDTLAFVKKAAGRILQTEDEYEIADWIYEQRRGLDTGLTITEQEPDWQGKAREEYRAGVLNLIRRKVRKRGAARTLAHVAFLMKDMDAELKAEIERVWPDARDEVWSEKDAAVFTEKELDRYGSQEKYVEEHAARARKASKWGKGKSPYQAQSYKLDHISRMEAAYIILLSQQEDYQEMLRLKGFTQEILEGLEQFAGSEVMEFSRALREKLNERGQEVKEVTESRYGAPFPMIENYFRAFFDVGIEAIDQSIMDAASYGDAATGGKFGLIHARKKHHASLDLSIDVLTAYYAAMNEQDVYLYGSEISRDMRALINYRGENGTRGARVLEKVIGRDALNKLLVWCDSFDKGMAGNVRGFLEMQKSLNRISSAAAITLLPGRVGTWLKQSSALINAAFSSDEIDPHEWAASMARMAAGKLALSPRELMKRAALDARDATETAVIREAMSADEAGRAASGAWKRLNVKGMNMLTQTDAGLNAVSSAILYDAVYRKEMKRNPGLSREEADRRAMMEVELSLSRKAQPMTPQQRSLAAQTRSVWNVGMLFLGGESINTFAETVALWKQGGMKNKAKSVSMFYAHGLLLAAMSAMLNFFTDDERRRKRREWWHIFIDALQGPLQGIPFWGALAGGAVRGMSSLCGYRYYEATTSLVPFASWDNLERAGKDLAKLFDGKDKDWVDFPLAFMGALRMAAFGAALGGASTPKGARFKAAAFSAAAFVNLTEFLLRAMKGLPLRLEGK
nr:MAG TPA: PolyVal ADP-Ribosyltransferase [Caudoviricetes sp.]